MCRERNTVSQEGFIINHFTSKCHKCVHAGISSVWLLSNHTLISALSDSLQPPGINTDSSAGSGADKSSVVQLMQWLQYMQALYRKPVRVSHPASSVKCYFSYEAFALFLCVCVTILITAGNSPAPHRSLSIYTRALSFPPHQTVCRGGPHHEPFGHKLKCITTSCKISSVHSLVPLEPVRLLISCTIRHFLLTTVIISAV